MRASGSELRMAAHLGLVAQLAERPVVCGSVEGATPFGSAILSLLPWSNTSGIRLLNGTMQVGILPAAPLPGGVKVARRFVTPHGVGASPTLAANCSPIHQPSTKGNPMRPVIRYQSQLLYRKSYKPNRVTRIRPSAKVNLVFRPSRRFGSKPQLEIVS